MRQRQVSLVFLIKMTERGQRKVLLAMKKKGFGKGLLNGLGGKFDEEKGDKTILDTAKRETSEEVGVNLLNFEKVGIINFYFPEGKKKFNQEVHIFIAYDWEGILRETEEMRPEWFDIKNIPYRQMWSGDKEWLKHVLAHKKLRGEIYYDENNIVVKNSIRIVKSL